MVITTPWNWQGKNLRLRLHVQPGAKTTELAGLHNGRLKIRLHAPPVEGKANRELTRFISHLFDLPVSAVQIEKGENSRLKTLLLEDPPFFPSQLLALDSEKPMVPRADSQ